MTLRGGLMGQSGSVRGYGVEAVNGPKRRSRKGVGFGFQGIFMPVLKAARRACGRWIAQHLACLGKRSAAGFALATGSGPALGFFEADEQVVLGLLHRLGRSQIGLRTRQCLQEWQRNVCLELDQLARA